MEDEKQDLRTIDEFLDALPELLRAVERGELAARQAYGRHVIGPRCRLLDLARRTKGAGFSGSRTGALSGFLAPSAPLIEQRIAVLDTIWLNHPSAQIVRLLATAVTRYADLWQYVQKDFIRDANARLAACGSEPAFMRRLKEPGAQAAMRTLAAYFGWLDPALLLVGETWAYVWNDDVRLPEDYQVEIWGLLAGLDYFRPNGVVAQLTLERVPGGCGAFYPSPLSCGYLSTKRSFQDALQNASWAAIGRQPLPCEFDVRWRLSVVDRLNDVPLDVVVKGRSIEAALACALQAVLAGEPLDQHTAVTAKFKNPGTADLSLDAVGGISRKLLAPEFASAAKLTQIREVVVAANQPEVTDNPTAAAKQTKIANGEVTLIPVADLPATYAHLGCWAKLTQFARKQLGDRAEQILKKRCAPYVKPQLSWKDPTDRNPGEQGGADQPPIPQEDFKRIIHGQLPDRNRLFVLGESGLGKSMFLVYCEQTIAQSDQGAEPYLPLRLGAGPKADADDPDGWLPLSEFPC